MSIDTLLSRIERDTSGDAIIWKDRAYSYGWLLDRITYWDEEIKKSPRTAQAIKMYREYMLKRGYPKLW